MTICDKLQRGELDLESAAQQVHLRTTQFFS